MPSVPVPQATAAGRSIPVPFTATTTVSPCKRNAAAAIAPDASHRSASFPSRRTRIVTVVEETLLEMGRTVAPPTRRAAAVAVIENPFAGKYVEDLAPLIAIGEELGELLAARAVAALGI